MIRRYETLIVIHPEIPEAQIRETIERAKRLIEEAGGEVHGMQEWGMRELAYPIRKLQRGYYVLAEYSATADVVRELERTLRITDEILRFLSVAAALPSTKEAPSKPTRKPEPAAAGAELSE
ncbi:MAG: 30S ribosomal protein S6 [Candidatus Binatia bacterium]